MIKNLSLTSRLTIFFTLVAATVVLGLGWLFMASADRHFLDLDRMALDDKRQLIEDILANSNSLEDARWRLGESLGHHHGLLVSIKNSSGQTLFKSKDFAFQDKPLLSVHGKVDLALQTLKSGSSEFHVIQFQAVAKYNQEEILTASLAIDAEHHQEFLDELQSSFAIYALFATMVSGVLGWIAAHQGMAPLRAMRSRAAEVSGQQLEGRMPVDAVPIEMADLARELNQMLDRLENDFRRLSEFSSDLAHELRTPISNLLTQTQVTLSIKRDACTYRDILASNAEELHRLARMVSDMLLLAKTERGVDLPLKEVFLAADDAQALIDFYEAVADDKKIVLTLEGNGPVKGDRLMFRRALSNLISNALRYARSSSCVKIIVVDRSNCTEISVENNGEDIDPILLPRLFDRFYRADQARLHLGSDGAGLGLAITKAIVEAHGGSASAFSARGTTRFTLKFPQ